MSELLEFTREEWADKPYLIELRGGYYDGNRHHWHELPLTWHQIEPAPPISILEYLSPEPQLGSVVPVAIYQRTRHVTDDGAHIYEFSGHE